MGRRENKLQAAVLEYLKLRGVFAWRNNTGMLWDRTGRPVKYGCVGSGDVLAIVPPHGRFLSIECKAPGARTKKSTKRNQEAWAEEVRAVGGLAITVDTLDDVEDALNGIED